MDKDDPVEPVNLRFLRRLVTVLTTVMIGGLLVVIGLLVTRLSSPPVPPSQSLALPDQITLPEGRDAMAFTQGPDWYAVVTTDNEILIYDRRTGNLRQTLTIN